MKKKIIDIVFGSENYRTYVRVPMYLSMVLKWTSTWAMLLYLALYMDRNAASYLGMLGLFIGWKLILFVAGELYDAAIIAMFWARCRHFGEMPESDTIPEKTE